jgi:hypothetical protein
MLGTAPEVISGYFDADARHDVDAIVARGELDQATAHRALTLPSQSLRRRRARGQGCAH